LNWTKHDGLKCASLLPRFDLQSETSRQDGIWQEAQAQPFDVATAQNSFNIGDHWPSLAIHTKSAADDVRLELGP
jgi:hypothetical protein